MTFAELAFLVGLYFANLGDAIGFIPLDSPLAPPPPPVECRVSVCERPSW